MFGASEGTRSQVKTTPLTGKGRRAPAPTRGGQTQKRLRSKAHESLSAIKNSPTGEVVVRLKGLEPPTLGSEDRCSIQLSHRRINAFDNKFNKIKFNT